MKMKLRSQSSGNSADAAWTTRSEFRERKEEIIRKYENQEEYFELCLQMDEKAMTLALLNMCQKIMRINGSTHQFWEAEYVKHAASPVPLRPPSLEATYSQVNFSFPSVFIVQCNYFARVSELHVLFHTKEKGPIFLPFCIRRVVLLRELGLCCSILWWNIK